MQNAMLVFCMMFKNIISLSRIGKINSERQQNRNCKNCNTKVIRVYIYMFLIYNNNFVFLFSRYLYLTRFVKKIKNPCGKVKQFIKAVNSNPVATPTKEIVVKESYKESQAWCDVQDKIDNAKHKKTKSQTPHFCPVPKVTKIQSLQNITHTQDHIVFWYHIVCVFCLGLLFGMW